MQAVMGLAVVAFFVLLLAELFEPTISFLVTALILGVEVWVMAVVIGFIVSSVSRSFRLKKYASIASLAKVVDVEFTADRIQIEPNSTLLDTYVKSIGRNNSGVVGFLVSAAVVYLVLFVSSINSSSEFIKGTKVSDTWIVILSMLPFYLLSLPAFSWLRGRGDISANVRERADSLSRNAEGVSVGWAALQKDVDKSAILWKTLEVSVQDNTAARLEAFVNINKIKVVTDPTILKSFLAEEHLRIRNEISQLEHVAAADQHSSERFREARLAVNEAGSLSMFDLLDQLRAAHQHAKGYLIKRDWSRFLRTSDEIDTQLKNLISAANQSCWQDDGSSEPTTSTDDPYQVLGVSTEMSLSQIEQVVRRLQNIYHPDRNFVKHDQRFKQIQAAWEAIRAAKRAH